MTRHTTIDWEEVQNRMRERENALEALLHPNEQTLQKTFDHRAKSLAQRATERRKSESNTALLVFRVAGTRCAIHLKYVAEIGPLKRCTEIPGTSPEIRGVFAHRGEVRSIIDLRILLGQPPVDRQACGYFVHVRKDGLDARFRVDELDQILSPLDSDFIAVTQEQAVLPAELVSGMTREGVIVLRAGGLLGRLAFRNPAGRHFVNEKGQQLGVPS